MRKEENKQQSNPSNLGRATFCSLAFLVLTIVSTSA